jgi:capsular polysaccharide biosynthesis protein
VELRNYWSILRDRWWIVVALAVLAFAFSLVARPEYQAGYTAELRVGVKPASSLPAGGYYSAEYYDYLASEYLVDDVGAAIETNAFLQSVLDQLKSRPGGAPFGSIATKKMHRVLTISVTSGNPKDATDIATTIGQTLTDPNGTFWKQLVSTNPDVSIIQPPIIVAAPGEKRGFLDIGLKTALGLLAGLGLAFLFEYLDDSLRGKADVERALGLPVLGEVPRDRRRRLGA